METMETMETMQFRAFNSKQKFHGAQLARRRVDQRVSGLTQRASCRLLPRAVHVQSPGVGKSFMVQAIGCQAIRVGYSVYYRSIFDLVRDFLHDEVLGQENSTLTKYLKPELLIIDDMGMKQLPRRSGECLFEVVMRRYETRSTMMTSNRPLEDWGKLLGDATGATAILDRFLHHAELVRMTGRSDRLFHFFLRFVLGFCA
jgi:hypothetical protein